MWWPRNFISCGDTGWGDTSDWAVKKSKTIIEEVVEGLIENVIIDAETEEYGQHHRKDESKGDIYIQHPGKLTSYLHG